MCDQVNIYDVLLWIYISYIDITEIHRNILRFYIL